MDGLYLIDPDLIRKGTSVDILYEGKVSSGYSDWTRKTPLFSTCIKKFYKDFEDNWLDDPSILKEYFKNPIPIAPIDLIIWRT